MASMTDPVVQRTAIPLQLSRRQLEETRCQEPTCKHPAGEHEELSPSWHYCRDCVKERRRGHRTADNVCHRSFLEINAANMQGRFSS